MDNLGVSDWISVFFLCVAAFFLGRVVEARSDQKVFEELDRKLDALCERKRRKEEKKP
jgi:hypothetical protein